VVSAVERQKALEAEINDIEHELELADLNYHARAKLAADLSKKLQERRREKDLQENLAPIVKAFKDANSLRGFEVAVGEARKIERRFETRTYKYKSKDGKIAHKG